MSGFAMTVPGLVPAVAMHGDAQAASPISRTAAT
jgi:hypothetical protein